MSHLSPLPQYLTPRTRVPSYQDLRAAALADPSPDPEWLPSHRHHPHYHRQAQYDPRPNPIHTEPRRLYHAALGHQPIVTESGAFVPPYRRPIDDRLPSWTLRHYSLRKTVNGESILSCGETSGVGRSSELPPRGYWQTDTEHGQMERNQTGAQVHASDISPYASSAIGLGSGYTVPLNVPNQQTFSSSYTTTTKNYNSVPPPLPSQPPLLSSSPGQQSAYSSQTTYHYVDPQNYTIKESYQSPPINDNGTQNYKSYTSTTITSYTDSNSPSHQFQQQTLPNTINNPKTYIYDFATRTPIAVLSPNAKQTNQSSTYSYSYSTSAPEEDNPVTPRKPLSYTEELRNSSLTETQRQSNQYQKSSLPGRQVPSSFHNIYEERIRSNQRTDQVDDLVKNMEMRLRTGRDICAKCMTSIVGDTPGVTALGKPYHVTCFSCDACNKQLAGCSFYNVDGKNLCQVDYMNSLEKCDKCATPITQKILRALGKPFHPECFVCPACNKSLDGIPFTVSKDNIAYCLDCYHERFSPRCAVCLKAIAPSGNETEVARVIAMDRSYHVSCYRCEDCGLQLNSKVEGAACYPLESHLFCKQCNLGRLKAVS